MTTANKSASIPARFTGAAAAVLFTLAVSPALALTGEEVLDKMSDEESSGYLAGNIDMAAQLSYYEGKRERSRCIFDWYYHKNGVEQVIQAISHFRDRQVQPVIYALINRSCGE